MDIQISIIIVNFNTSKLLKECIHSIKKDSNNPTFEIIVVDNNSKDDSIEMLKTNFPQVKVFANQDNKGFAAANNQGIHCASGRYIWLLNPDTIVFPGCLTRLLTFMESNSNAGAISPRTWLDTDKTLEVCSLKPLTPERAKAVFTRLPCKKRPAILRKSWELDSPLWTTNSPVSVEGIGGAAFFISKDLLLANQGLDERFFMGYEDTDLSMFVLKQNKQIFIVPDAEIVHLFGQAKQHPDAPEKAVYSWQTAPVTFIRKYYGDRLARTFKIQRLIDGFWRRLIPEPAIPFTTTDSPHGISLTWKGDPHELYCIEVSNDPSFFDKFGKCTQGNTFIIPSHILDRLQGTRWYWRVWSVKDGDCLTPIATGSWKWPPHHNNS